MTKPQNSTRKFDLKDRILAFVIATITLTKKLPRNTVNIILIQQIVRCVTSIGANYEEADGSRSVKEFISTMGLVKKEAKETKYWLTVIDISNNNTLTEEISILLKENEELIRIFAKIIINSNHKSQ